jgi:hypothetical protein
MHTAPAQEQNSHTDSSKENKGLRVKNHTGKKGK